MKKNIKYGLFLIILNLFFSQSFAQEAVIWTDLVNTTASGNTITKISGGNNWNGGGASQNVLAANADGWVELTVQSTNTGRVIGLSNTNANASYTTINYGVVLRLDGELRVYENGTYMSVAGSIPYNINDVVRIERSGTSILYKHNGTTIYTSTVPSNGSMVVDASLYSINSSIPNVLVDFESAPEPTCDDNIQNGDETGIDCGGSCPNECNNSSIIWTDLVNTTASGNTITKVSGGNNWNGGGASQNILAANTDGWVELTVQSTNTGRIIGLSNTNANASYATIDYGIVLRLDGELRVYENGTYMSVAGSIPYSINDVVRIERSGTSILYKHNGTIIYTSAAPSSESMIVDVSIYSVNTSISTVTINFEGSSEGTCDDGIQNGDETGVDCGGSCNACSTCDDGVQNGNETGVDCGGSCNACSTCDDNVQNGDETGVDCGGSCDACSTCDDGIQNGDETGVDCGGSCPSSCGGGGAGSSSLWTESGNNIHYSNGKVWIGNVSLDVSPAEFNLFVEKGIMTERLKVAIEDSGDWADYVFKKGYNLITIDDMKAFIAEKGHLPNMPSAKEVAEKGIDVAKMNALLLQQIEESKLYIIQLNEKINHLEKRMQKLDN